MVFAYICMHTYKGGLYPFIGMSYTFQVIFLSN